jgi:hypothetical protein
MIARPFWTVCSAIAALTLSGSVRTAQSSPVTIRTEAYPRPPYSEATYYVYERDGHVICTKLAVCDKYDQCDTDYHAGAFVDPEDQKTGEPHHATAAVPIPRIKRSKHQCLAEFVPDAL